MNYLPIHPGMACAIQIGMQVIHNGNNSRQGWQGTYLGLEDGKRKVSYHNGLIQSYSHSWFIENFSIRVDDITTMRGFNGGPYAHKYSHFIASAEQYRMARLQHERMKYLVDKEMREEANRVRKAEAKARVEAAEEAHRDRKKRQEAIEEAAKFHKQKLEAELAAQKKVDAVPDPGMRTLYVAVPTCKVDPFINSITANNMVTLDRLVKEAHKLNPDITYQTYKRIGVYEPVTLTERVLRFFKVID